MVPRESALKVWSSCRLRPSIFCRPLRLRFRAVDSALAGNLTESPLPQRRPDADRADPAGQRAARAEGRAAQPDAATQLARSNLPGLVKSKVPFMVSVAELDPPNIIAFAETLKDELCKAGHCPTYMVLQGS